MLKETIAPRSKLPPLLSKLSERPPETVDYVGVAYGLTTQLYRFWKRAGFLPVYLRQTPVRGPHAHARTHTHTYTHTHAQHTHTHTHTVGTFMYTTQG